MKERGWITIGLISFMLIGALVMAMGSKLEQQEPLAPTQAPPGGTVEGRIIGIEGDTMVVKTDEGESVRFVMTAATKQDRQFQIGDQIEAVMSPQGIATSVHLRKQAFRR